MKTAIRTSSLSDNEIELLRRYALEASVLPVQVSFGDGMYTAECDNLQLVTEARTLDALRSRVLELVPDLIEANGLNLDPERVRLHFAFAEDMPSRSNAAR